MYCLHKCITSKKQDIESYNSHFDFIVELLQSKNFDINTTDSEGRTGLIEACSEWTHPRYRDRRN